MSEVNHDDASRNVRPRLMDEPDPWLSLLVGHEEAMAWAHVANTPHLHHDPFAGPFDLTDQSYKNVPDMVDPAESQPDDIDDCPSLGIDSHCVRSQ